jgi:hypothetical protein
MCIQIAYREQVQEVFPIPVIGQVNPHTWEVLDMHENPYRAPLPWKS